MKRAMVLLSLLLLVQGSVLRGGTPEKVDFRQDIRPILSENCFTCHGPDVKQRKAGLRLDVAKSALSERGDYAPAVVPGNPEESELYLRVVEEIPDFRMPPPKTGKELTEEQIDLLKRWIEQGAEFEDHWSFIPPVRPPLPEVERADWPANEIDRFILARLEREGLAPSPEADRYTVVRRLTLDLTGLPPTPEEVDAFVADQSADAYEKLVDRLLASPRYGEHMARYWLDAARYGDTHGLHLDNYREMWPYRDWVIRAFNSNMPYDQFVTEQLAGDLLPDPSLDQLIASGFNRCHVTTNEGGSIAEEVYVRNVIDRVTTTGEVLLAMTFECTRCHDHKYDPFTMKEFYQLFAFFNNLDGPAMDGNRKDPAPVVKVPTPEETEKLAELREKLAGVDKELAELEPRLDAAQAEWEKTALDTLPKTPTEGLAAHYELDNHTSDTSGHYRHGTFRNGDAAYGAGRVGAAAKFDGKAHVDVGNTADFERNDRFACGAWIRPAAKKQMAVIAKIDQSAASRGFELYLDEGKLFARLVHQWEDNAIGVGTKQPLAPDAWHHVMLTYDGSGKAEGVRLLVDGKSQEVDVLHDTLSGSIRTPAPLRFGGRGSSAPYQGLIDDVRIYSRELTSAEVAQLAEHHPARMVLAIAPDRRGEEQKSELVKYYRANHGPARFRELQSERTALVKREKEIDDSLPTTLVFRERAEPREAFVLKRGEYDQRGEKVARDTPDVLPPLGDDRPRNRLGFARWLLDPGHPLTSRVAVNRFWQQCFGTGIVKTSENFGSQGDVPSHPELLDWLAVKFIEDGWDVKKTMKRFVMSATYRQSSNTSSELAQRDPANRLLARGPRFRLDAEVLRDQALAASGLLVEQIGGPSVKPPQPDGLWYAVGYSGSNTVRFVQDKGPEKVYRRSLYTFWKRTAPPPQMNTFDAPSRESCTVRRERTNTPLQALLLMNDPQYVEAARHLAELAIKRGGETPEDRATFMFRRAVARPPAASDLADLLGAYRDQLAHYQAAPEDAKKLTAVGQSEPEPSLDVAELAAWTIVANVILNLDEVVTKR